jgi:hypothetical protein
MYQTLKRSGMFHSRAAIPGTPLPQPGDRLHSRIAIGLFTAVMGIDHTLHAFDGL